MKRDWIIKADRLVKEYHVYERPMDRFVEIFLKVPRHRVFRALDDVTLEVRKGEAVGVVGENGSGKSTFLKLVTGVIDPSSGGVATRGKVAAILELGTGFNPEFTGRENVVLNAALHGLSSSMVKERMSVIERFADIGEFFDLPVKTYSSGMYVRLAFALAVNVDADIIVIDEAIAVGDGYFQKKCIDKISDLRRKGVTILFCSHSLYTIVMFCDRTIWLRQGKAVEFDETKSVILKYEDYLREKETLQGRNGMNAEQSERQIARIHSVNLCGDENQGARSIGYLSDLEFKIDFEIFEPVPVYLGFAVDRNDGICCYADSMHLQKMEPYYGPGRHVAILALKRIPLLSGAYKLVIFLIDDTGICIYDRQESPVFKVEIADKKWGIVPIDFQWIR